MDVRFCENCQEKMPFVSDRCAKCRSKNITKNINASIPSDAGIEADWPAKNPAKTTPTSPARLLLIIILVFIGGAILIEAQLQWTFYSRMKEETKKLDERLTAATNEKENLEKYKNYTTWNVERLIKSRLRDPDSYQRDTAVVLESPGKGVIGAVITYRAKNGFGGYTMGFASGNCNMQAENCKLITME